jgi:hypothetical protein
MAGDASAARFVPTHTPVEAPSHGRIDADDLNHAIHDFGLAHDPVQHRATVAKVAHGHLLHLHKVIWGK